MGIFPSGIHSVPAAGLTVTGTVFFDVVAVVTSEVDPRFGTGDSGEYGTLFC